jgi:hypothetical protein
MATATATIGGMPKKKPGKPGRPPGRKPTAPIFARIDLDLFQAWHDHVERLKPKTTINAMVALAIEEYLRSKGDWPPPPLTEEDGE